MSSSISPEARTAPSAADQLVSGPVTLMNVFTVDPGRDAAFQALWNETSRYFVARPGFVSLKLHRLVGPDAAARWVNVANWGTEADYRAAHSTEEFRRVVTLEGWEEFPSTPRLYEVVTAIG
jgi:heme-degrading monooxygenase HmoA